MLKLYWFCPILLLLGESNPLAGAVTGVGSSVVSRCSFKNALFIRWLPDYLERNSGVGFVLA